MKKSVRKYWALALVSALGLASAPAVDAADKRPVALIIAQGGLGDQSYNDLANAGFKKALAETGLKGRAIESKDVVAQANDMLRSASDAGFGLVIDLEYSHGEALAEVARDYPGTQYAIFNQVRPGANVASVVFQEQDGSFLAGALAAMMASDPKVKGSVAEPRLGFIGGAKSVGIDKFLVGYIQGAHQIDPRIKVEVAYANTFGDPAKGLQTAKAMFERGVVIVYQVAGGTGLGAIKAAAENGRYAIGVDSDQDGLAKGHVLTSVIKSGDVAVERLVRAYASGQALGGKVVNIGLEGGGVKLSPMKYTADLIGKARLDKLAKLQADIEAGRIKVWNVVDQGYPDFYKP
ncbi:MAG: BMP family ABC transporter substrate-binding protein [Burkholderiales bacterium]|nr:BMP family ABC transporter substrate-binding protein [Burkholderiales bacterium]